jgi:hypothetical protein
VDDAKTTLFLLAMMFRGLDEVPSEVWRLIANEIVEATVLKEFPAFLMSVNRQFFDVYLEHKYKEIHWTKLDAHTVRELQSLQYVDLGSPIETL